MNLHEGLIGQEYWADQWCLQARNLSRWSDGSHRITWKFPTGSRLLGEAGKLGNRDIEQVQVAFFYSSLHHPSFYCMHNEGTVTGLSAEGIAECPARRRTAEP